MSLKTVPILHLPPTRTRAHTHTHTHTQRSPHLGADRNEGERICDECGTRRRRGERWGGRKKQRGIVNIVEPRGANSHVVSLSTYAGHSCACARARVCVCVLSVSGNTPHSPRRDKSSNFEFHTHALEARTRGKKDQKKSGKKRIFKSRRVSCVRGEITTPCFPQLTVTRLIHACSKCLRKVKRYDCTCRAD